MLKNCSNLLLHKKISTHFKGNRFSLWLVTIGFLDFSKINFQLGWDRGSSRKHSLKRSGQVKLKRAPLLQVFLYSPITGFYSFSAKLVSPEAPFLGRNGLRQASPFSYSNFQNRLECSFYLGLLFKSSFRSSRTKARPEPAFPISSETL